MPRLPPAWWTDARHYQIAALATLLTYNLGWLDFGARPLNAALAIGFALATQALCTHLLALPRLDLRSPLITGLSLSLLLRSDEPWLSALAAVIAIGSKFLLRIDGKHIFNPAGLAIVMLLFAAPDSVWISPGQWGSTAWLAALLVFFAILVLSAARRADIAIFFLGSHAALLLVRAWWPDSAYVWFFGVALFGALFVWLMIFVTHIAFCRVTGAHDRRPPVASYVGAAAIAGMLLATWWVPGLESTLVAGGPWMALLGFGYWLSGTRAPA